MNLSTKQKQTHRQVFFVCRGLEVWGRDSLGLVDENLYIEWINNKVLLYSTGNYIQYPVINHNGKEHDKEH